MPRATGTTGLSRRSRTPQRSHGAASSCNGDSLEPVSAQAVIDRHYCNEVAGLLDNAVTSYRSAKWVALLVQPKEASRGTYCDRSWWKGIPDLCSCERWNSARRREMADRFVEEILGPEAEEPCGRGELRGGILCGRGGGGMRARGERGACDFGAGAGGGSARLEHRGSGCAKLERGFLSYGQIAGGPHPGKGFARAQAPLQPARKPGGGAYETRKWSSRLVEVGGASVTTGGPTRKAVAPGAGASKAAGQGDAWLCGTKPQGDQLSDGTD